MDKFKRLTNYVRNNFDELAILLHKKDLLKNTKLILNNIDNNFFNTREFLSSYMINKFPEDDVPVIPFPELGRFKEQEYLFLTDKESIKVACFFDKTGFILIRYI